MGIQYRPIMITVGPNSSKIAIGIIDTGADKTIVSEKTMRELGVDIDDLDDIIETFTITGECKIIKAMVVELTEIWAEKRSKILTGITNDFFDSAEQGEGIDVIIGSDFLQDTNYELKFVA